MPSGMATEPDKSRWQFLEVDLTDEERAAWERRQRDRASVAEQMECERARREDGPWVPACNGTEVPFYTRTGHCVLYCWQPSTGRHAYLDCGTDLIIPDADLAAYGLGA
jgi:hypothetical protein